MASPAAPSGFTQSEGGPRSARPTRDLLVEEGIAAFSTRGFDGASLREIERDAGVGRGLVAHHFGTKDGLWRACVDELMGRFHAELDRVREHLADVSPVERARVLLRVYVRFAARNPEYTRLLMLSGAEDSERVRWMVDTWIRPNNAFFDRLTGRETASPELSGLFTYAFMGAASLLFTTPVEAALIFDLDVEDEDLAERFADVLVAWVGFEVDDDDGTVTSAFDRAVWSVEPGSNGGRPRR